jgi:hypothetical protein
MCPVKVFAAVDMSLLAGHFPLYKVFLSLYLANKLTAQARRKNYKDGWVNRIDLIDFCGWVTCGVCPGSPELKTAGTDLYRFTNALITSVKTPACGGRAAGQG